MSASINPKTLKHFRNSLNISQQGLSNICGVSKKTIARIERGQSSVNTTTADRLAKVFNITHEELANPINKKSKGEQVLHAIGYKRVSQYIHENAWLALQMVEKCYGIKPQVQLTMAPLFAALMAEGSLAWRSQKLEAAEEAAKILDNVDYGHLGFMLGAAKVDEMAGVEKESIEQYDIFGKQTLEHVYKQGLDPRAVNPFVEYLCHFARENDSELIKVLPGAEHDAQENLDSQWLATLFSFPQCDIYYSINEDELDRLVGDNEWAGRALQWGYVKIADIPEELLGDDALEDRVKWLEKQIPSDRRAEQEAFWTDLISEINL